MARNPDKMHSLLTILRQEHELDKRQVKADINVTPLVDVVLVLLIIFMVVTPLIASGVAVDLPRTAHHQKKPDDGKDIIVSITWDKHTFVGSRPCVGVDDMVNAINAEKRKSPEKTVFLKGDIRTPYGVMREAMEALHRADVDDVILGTEELVKN